MNAEGFGRKPENENTQGKSSSKAIGKNCVPLHSCRGYSSILSSLSSTFMTFFNVILLYFHD